MLPLRRWLAAAACAGLGFAAEPDAPVPSRELGLPFFEIVDPRDYQGHTQVWGAAQDAAGLIYFGNYGRVLVYDGARWDRLDVPGTSFVRAVAVDAQDTLWVGGVNELGYAAAGPQGTRTFVSLRDRLPPEALNFGELWRVVLTTHGPLFQSNSWLLRWDGTRFASLALPPGAGWQAVDAGGTVVITHGQRGWWTLRDDGATLALQPLPQPPELAGATLQFALPGGATGETIFGTPKLGLVRWDGRIFTPFRTEVDETLKARRLYRGIRLPDGRLVLALVPGGAFILDAQGRLLAQLDESAGLPDNSAVNVFAARSGELWISLERGLARVDARPWLTWFGPARGAPRSVLGTPVRFNDRLLFASDAGIVQLVPARAGAAARLDSLPGFPEAVYGLSVDGDTLFGCGQRTLFAVRHGTRNNLPGDPTNAFNFEPARTMAGRWFAVMDGGLHAFRREGDTWISEGPVAGLENVRSLVEEADGTWWMGTPNDGVLRVTFPDATRTRVGAPRIVRLTAGAGLPAGHGWTRISLDARGPLLRCEKGFFRFDATTQAFKPTTEFGARFADGTTTARTTVADPHGGTWMVARPAGQAELITTLELGLASADSWRPLPVPQLGRLDDVSSLMLEPATDTLWITGQAGVIRVDLAQWRNSPPPPAPTVLLRRVATGDGAPLPLGGDWKLPYARRSLRVDLAAPALGADPGARFESTLLGAGDPIVLLDPTPGRQFPALGSGRYTLQFRARSGDGRWSPPVEVSFLVLPPWWRSAWAWLAYIVAGAGSVGLIVRARIRALHRRAEALEATVAARTEDLRRSNAELARLHKLELDEKIAAQLAEQSARLELLRYQLNPHFLFNALNSIRARVFVNAGSAGDMISQLAAFFRSTLARGSDELRSLAEEFATLRTYLEIEQARWEDEMSVEFILDPDAAASPLPPFLLLPLVENAVKYGGRTTPEKLRVRVSARRHLDGHVLVEVANTGRWIPPGVHVPSVESTGVGLTNLRQRLARYYPDAHELATTERDGWVIVQLTIADLRLPIGSNRQSSRTVV